MQQKPTGDKTGFAVTGWVHRVGGFVARHPGLWIRLGNWESRIARDAITGAPIKQPVYVAGLARSGSTILLETLAAHPQVATHRYRDDPFLFTPYLWNRWLDRLPRRAEVATERTHKDGIAVTSESPEAFEEALWMAFFPDLHDSRHSAVLGKATRAPAFEQFYRDHIRKLLSVRGRQRYVAKGNYNITRIAYLANLFPDARFVIPVRDPVGHIASLMKQHALFLRGQQGNPRAVQHLQRIGHFEFGQDRRIVNVGDHETVAEIAELWRTGEDVRGWARYWAMIHRFLADQISADDAIARRCLVVRYQDLCIEPEATIRGMLDHCGLPADEMDLAASTSRIRFPSYYRPAFTDDELAIIAEETQSVAARFGYGGDAQAHRAEGRRAAG